MFIGDRQTFAVEIEIRERVNGWVYGTFLFWLSGVAVGDAHDDSVDLQGCASWVRDFLNFPRDRVDAEIFDMPADRVFRILYHSVMSGPDDGQNAQEVLEDSRGNVFSRFHVSHLGMSSFNDVSILLVENDSGRQRFVWQQGNNPIHDTILPKHQVRNVLDNTVKWFQSETGY